MAVDSLAAFNMSTACRLTRGLVVNNPVKPDLSPDYVAVQGWPLVTALYNGIEQALKMLLLVPPNPCFTLEALAKRPYGHDLEQLYAELEADDRDHIELHFREHRSLHDYKPPGLSIATAEQFIAHINSGGRQGGPGLLAVHPDTGHLTDSVDEPLDDERDMGRNLLPHQKGVFNKQNDCSSLSRRLMWGFNRRFPTLVPYKAFNDDMRTWAFHEGDGPLAAWIDLLVKAHGDAIHEVQAPDQLRPVLVNVADRALKKMASDSADPDEAQLLHRIQTDPNLAWDPSDGVFR